MIQLSWKWFNVFSINVYQLTPTINTSKNMQETKKALKLIFTKLSIQEIGVWLSIREIDFDRFRLISIYCSNFISAKQVPETVEFEDILAVCSACSNHYFLHNEHFTKKKSKGLSSSSISDVSNIKSCHSFEVHYVTTHPPKCKVETVTFCHSNLSIVTQWIDTLRLRVESKDFIHHFQ